jgi:hypothetical protein
MIERTMHGVAVMGLALLSLTVTVVAQQAESKPADPSASRKTVETWFALWNRLDGTAAATEAVVELYMPDAIHSTGPASHQLGTVSYRGHDNIRKMVSDFAALFEKPSYRIEAVTAKEQTAQLFNAAAGPWGGPSVAVEFVAVHTSRETGKRVMQPGAAFFQILNGKIRRLRLYMADGEEAEVEPEVARPRRP